MKICVGGTFNYLHKGHKEILKRAFEYAGKDGKVFIGLSTGDLVKNKKNTKSFESRREKLIEYLNEKGYKNQATILSIKNKFGLTLEIDFDPGLRIPEPLPLSYQPYILCLLQI